MLHRLGTRKVVIDVCFITKTGKFHHHQASSAIIAEWRENERGDVNVGRLGYITVRPSRRSAANGSIITLFRLRIGRPLAQTASPTGQSQAESSPVRGVGDLSSALSIARGLPSVGDGDHLVVDGLGGAR